MLNDAFKLTIDKIHQPPDYLLTQMTRDQPFKVPGYGDYSNMWHKLCNLQIVSSYPSPMEDVVASSMTSMSCLNLSNDTK